MATSKVTLRISSSFVQIALQCLFTVEVNRKLYQFLYSLHIEHITNKKIYGIFCKLKCYNSWEIGRSITNKQGILVPCPSNRIEISCLLFSFMSGSVFISFMFQESPYKSSGTNHALLCHFSIAVVLKTTCSLGPNGHQLLHMTNN